MNKQKNKAYISARDNGFYNDPLIADYTLGIASEITEAWNSKMSLETPLPMDHKSLLEHPESMDAINNTVEMELIDCQLRLLSLAGYLNFDLTPDDHQKMEINVACDPRKMRLQSDFLLHLQKEVSTCTTWVHGKWEIEEHHLIVPIMMIENYLTGDGIDTEELRDLKLEYNKARGFLHGKH